MMRFMSFNCQKQFTASHPDSVTSLKRGLIWLLSSLSGNEAKRDVQTYWYHQCLGDMIASCCTGSSIPQLSSWGASPNNKRVFLSVRWKDWNLSLKEHGAANSFLRCILNLVHLNIWKVNAGFNVVTNMCKMLSFCSDMHDRKLTSVWRNTYCNSTVVCDAISNWRIIFPLYVCVKFTTSSFPKLTLVVIFPW